MLWKCCTQYANKFGKLSSGHRTGKCQFSFQSLTKAMPKNIQATAQLHSSHILAKYWSKFSKPGFNSMWPRNFQMFKLDLEKEEEPEIKLPTSIGTYLGTVITWIMLNWVINVLDTLSKLFLLQNWEITYLQWSTSSILIWHTQFSDFFYRYKFNH